MKTSMRLERRARLAPTQFVFARHSRAGLANELLVLAKAHLASLALGAPLLRPQWGLNTRRYWPYFYRTSLAGVGSELARRLIPTVSFDEKAYRLTGLVDYGEAISAWASANDILRRHPLAIQCEGLWGGVVAVERAREFIRGTLLGTYYTQSNIAGFMSQREARKLLVGLHLRRGDFETSPADADDLRGKWNTAIPNEWFTKICESLTRALGDRVQFAVFSDAAGPEVPFLPGIVNPLTTHGQKHADCSDLLLMSLCDVLVCSPSSYSILAAWLSDRPYIWPAEQCWLEDGWFSLWGNEDRQRPPSGLTAVNRRAVELNDGVPISRGLPVDASGTIPQDVVAHLVALLSMRDTRTDLIRYGVVPAGTAE